MSSSFENPVFLCLLAVVAAASANEQPPGFLEGHFKIFSSREVELAEATPSEMTVEDYSDYPVIVLSRDGNKEIARVTPNKEGNYRVALAPGDYVLDLQGRRRGHVRATPQSFTIVSNQTVHMDMNIDTGVR